MTTGNSPQLDQQGRGLRRLYQRWRVFPKYHVNRLLANWTQPVARVDREWLDDDRLIYGYSTDADNVGKPNSFPAVMLFAGGEREAHVRRLDYRITSTGNNYSALLGRECAVQRAWGTYDPIAESVADGVAGEFFPALQTNDSDIPGLPQFRVVSGYHNLLQAVTIGGVPVGPFIGPRYMQTSVGPDGSSITSNVLQPTPIWDWDDPPIIVPPNGKLFVQFFNPQGGATTERLWVNWYVSEREVG